MEFLYLLTLVNILPSLIISTTTRHPRDKNPLICEWKHINGTSGYYCPNGVFSDDEGVLWRSLNGYTSVHKVEPEYVKWPSGYPIDIKFLKQKFFEQINQYRLIHRVPELKISTDLEAQAQERANNLANANAKSSINWENKEGNGVSTIYVEKKDLSNVVEKWHDQMKYYNFEQPDSNYKSQTGDFSQMVWGGSSLIGCGIANSGPDYYASCFYSPAGNIQGQYEQNVKKEYATVNLGFRRI